MTHYMELLAANQPWNLLIFMAVPVILAETVAITELQILFTRNFTGTARILNRWAGLLGAAAFAGIFLYLFANAVVPLTLSGGWRGPADVIAVGSYLLGVLPLAGIGLLEAGVIGSLKDSEEKLKLHAMFVGAFLIVAHVAMIFGMLNPEILGWSNPDHLMQMP